ncbi:MAG TPA: alpha/beta fold hydrolase, partial [Polyangiales bacterium]
MSAFVRPRELSAPTLRLVVFHHAGGSASTYYPLTRALPSDWDLLIAELPGRGSRHALPPMREVASITTWMRSALADYQDVPLALFGHSFGAIVASEVARVLEGDGVPLTWLGLSGRAAPSSPRAPRRLHELDDDALLRELLALGGTPDKIHDYPELKQRFLRIARADLAAVDAYQPDPRRSPLRCPIAGYTGEHDAWAPPDSMRPWSRETRGACALRTFPGGHFYFLGEPFSSFARAIV